MELKRVRELIAAFKDQRILVVGDIMLDRYLYGAVERISPEAPVPILKVTREKRMPGGAANVAANIRALGGKVVLSGMTGADAAGAELLQVLRNAGIDTEGVARMPGITTTVKLRVIAERQQLVRIDWERPLDVTAQDRRDFARRTSALAKRATGVILEDYSKGVIDQQTVDAVLAAVQRRRTPVGLDPKDNRDLRLAGITLATPNCKEAHICAGLPARSSVPGDPLKDEILRRAGAILMKQWRPRQLIVTLGAQGMYLVSGRDRPQVIPTRAREVFDVSGAGDTVIAACLLAMASGATPYEAAVLGNYAAGVVVGKLGTASCSPAELIDSIAKDG